MMALIALTGCDHLQSYLCKFADVTRRRTPMLTSRDVVVCRQSFSSSTTSPTSSMVKEPNLSMCPQHALVSQSSGYLVQ
jgi:hypothetical protein